MTPITPLIICGGNGTRLWPVSRTMSPKQFQKVGEDDSLTFFQAAVQRHRGEGYGAPCIVSSVRYSQTVAEQLSDIGCDADVILEPMGRNTGPAVLAAAMRLYARDEDALMVVVPADHVINGDVTPTVMAMVEPAKAGHIVTFGIKPRYAETGFGYITDGGPILDFPGLHRVERFVEKPPTRKARRLVESDIAYWASGISMFAARTIIEEYAKFDPDTVVAVRAALAGGEQRNTGFVLNEARFGEAAAEPTESVVFERTKKIALAPLAVDWSDVGSWTAMYGISKANHQGNVLQGDVIAVESSNSLVRSTSRLVTLVGMSDVIVIDTPDALLVTKIGQCQSVKKIAESLRSANRVEAEKHVAAPQTDSAVQVSTMIKSDSIEMLSISLVPGARHALGSGAQRDIMVVKGALSLLEAGVRRPLGEGQRTELLNGTPAELINTSAEPVEVVLTTLMSAQDAAPAERPVPKIVPKAVNE